MENVEKNELHMNGHIHYIKTITKPSGEQVRLIARLFNVIKPGQAEMSIDVFKMVADEWELCKTSNDDNTWISREHYLKNQRPEHLEVAGIGSILKVNQEFNTLLFSQMNTFENIGTKEEKENGLFMRKYKDICFQLFAPL